MNEKKPLSIIVINYKSGALVKRCILSFSKQLQKECIEHEWIVVNNSSSENLSEITKLGALVLHSSKNEGFAKGCNRGAQEARGEAIWFLNPDTEYKKGSISSALSLLYKKKSVGVVGAQLFDENEKPQKWAFGKTLTFWVWLENKIMPHKSIKREEIKKVGWVSGASCMIQKNTFFCVGGFDENYFMYFEDMDFCLRLFHKTGLYPFHTTTLSICHWGGKSFKKNKKNQKRWYYSSMRRYAQKHLPWWQRFFFTFLTRCVERCILV